VRPSRASVGYLLAFGSAATGAVRYNFARYAYDRGFPFVPFLFFALVVGVACCAVHVLARDGARGFVPLRGKWRHALLYGVLMAWGTLSHFVALEHLNETVMSSLAQTSILLTIALAVWLLGERFTWREALATLVICAGVFLFRPWDIDNLEGFVILMGGVLGTSLATVGAKRWVVGVPPRVMMVWRNAVALVVVGAWWFFHYVPFQVTWQTALACVAAGVFGPYLHGLFFLQALERIDAAKASLMSRVQPVIVFLVSWTFLARVPELRDGISAALLVIGTMGLVLAHRTPRSKR
jgi:drug/metabolite transporter (DMT)-like permease